MDNLVCVYIVVFYMQSYGPASVKIAGTYINKDDALNRIFNIFGKNYRLSNNNTIIYSKNGLCGWINKNNIGDYNNFNLNINQPYNSIQLCLQTNSFN